jgi:hypothetical protein
MVTSGSRWSTVLRIVLTALALVVLLVVVLIGIVSYQFHRATTPPDVAAIARSAKVVQADRRAEATVDGQVAAAIQMMPWPAPATTAVEDVCESLPGSFFGQGYGPVRCTRRVTRFLSFDGDLAARSAAWDRALRGAGWTPSGSSGNAPGVPPSVEYRDPAGVALTVVWGERPQLPLLRPSIRIAHDSDTQVFRASVPVDADATIREAYAHSRYVVVATGFLAYY